MKYLILPALDNLTKQMSKCDLGDFVINGKIEAYSCKRAGQDKRTAKSLEKQFKSLASSPKVVPSSPLGPIGLPSTRKLLISLITTMNNSFPDYDFSDLRPEEFAETKSKDVIDSLNGLFIDSMDGVIKDFRANFWKVLDEVVQTEKCQIFTYKPGFESSSRVLWATNFFFYNKKLKKIVFFIVSATSKLALASGKQEAEAEEDSDLEMEMEEDETVTAKSGSLARGYVDVDLLDMDDLGLEAIDMPESKWIPAEDFSLGSLSTFATETSKQDSQLGPSRSLFEGNKHPDPSHSFSTSAVHTSSVFPVLSSVTSPSKV